MLRSKLANQLLTRACPTMHYNRACSHGGTATASCHQFSVSSSSPTKVVPFHSNRLVPHSIPVARDGICTFISGSCQHGARMDHERGFAAKAGGAVQSAKSCDKDAQHTVVLVESPAKARKIQGYLGERYTVNHLWVTGRNMCTNSVRHLHSAEPCPF